MIRLSEFNTQQHSKHITVGFLLNLVVEKELDKISNWNKDAIKFISNLTSSAAQFVKNDPLSNIEIIYQTNSIRVCKFKSTGKFYIDIYCFDKNFSDLVAYIIEEDSDNPYFSFKPNNKRITFKIEYDGMIFVDTILTFVTYGKGADGLTITLTEV